MAHALTTRQNGFVEYAYATEEGGAWHGLGQGVASAASLEEWTKAAGMEWRILRSKVRYAVDRTGDTNLYLELPDQHVLFRSDTKAALGIVSDRYKVVQPAETLAFFKAVAGVEGLDLSSAGTLFDGKRFFATAKIGESSPVGSRDKIGFYLLISTSADGSLATEVRITSIRVVCNNTLQMAFGDAKAAVRLTHRSTFDAEAVHRQLGTLKARESIEVFDEQMSVLADTPMPEKKADDFLVRLLSKKARDIVLAEGPEADKVRESLGYQSILGLFNGAAKGSQFSGVRGTAYGMLNAVTEHVDHHIRATSDANRFASAQWGPGAAMKGEALQILLADAAAAR